MIALTPIAGLAACVGLHVAMSRDRPEASRPIALACAVVAGAVFVVAVGSGHVASLPIWLATYGLLAYGYVIGVFNLGESSRRIRLLIELHEAPGQTMTLEEILAVYNARMIMEARLRRLMAAGLVIEDDGRYWIGNRAGLWIGRALGGLAPLLAQRRR